jgi:hypothetical protein
VADSIREALTKAIGEDEETPVVVSTPAPEPVVESIADPDAPVIGAAPEVKSQPATPATAALATAKTADPTTPAAVAAPAVIAAPASWKAAEKAAWDKVPAEARAAIQRRELETQRVLSTSAEARKHKDSFGQAMAPYQPLFDAYGVKEPLQALIPLMQTRAALEVGTPEQKAQLISNLVYQFGIDITKLDGYLVKGPGQQMPIQPQQAFDPKSIPELAPLFQIAEQFKAAQSTKVDQAISEVSSLPYFEDLREEAADLLDAAAAKGRNLSLKQAFDIAAQMAGITPVPDAPSAKNVSEAAAMLAKSRRAASSVAGAPKQGSGTKPTSLRETIEAAMAG